jgi:hypothetical protein
MHLSCLTLSLLFLNTEAASLRGLRGLFSPASRETQNAAALKNDERLLLRKDDFVPLSCNNGLTPNTSCKPWTDLFGASNVHTEEIIIPCGQCVEMNHPGPELTLHGGLNIHGRLRFPNNYKLTLSTTLIVVQGEMEMEATKAVDGIPNISFTMIGENERTFTPIGENAGKCDGEATCKAGKKAIVVAGGKVTSKY